MMAAATAVGPREELNRQPTDGDTNRRRREVRLADIIHPLLREDSGLWIQ
jgi:hypothetical protein